jgi:hypothetical protein
MKRIVYINVLIALVLLVGVMIFSMHARKSDKLEKEVKQLK